MANYGIRRFIMKKICSIIVVLLILVLVFIGWNKLQDYIFFHPWNDLISYKKLQKISAFEEIEIVNDEVSLSGWLWDRHPEEEMSPLLIFFTGNAQNSSNTLYNYYSSGSMDDILGDYNLMIVDYPGYGMSKGKPSDDSMFIASNYVYEYATNMKKVDKNNIVIIGYSIGTGVASYCASVNEASALILVAPYDKALSLYNDSIDSFHGPIENLAKYSFDSVTYAESVIEPTLIFTSKADEVISYQHSLNLAGHFSELDDVILLEGVNHNGYFNNSEVLDGIKEFLIKVRK